MGRLQQRVVWYVCASLDNGRWRQIHCRWEAAPSPQEKYTAQSGDTGKGCEKYKTKFAQQANTAAAPRDSQNILNVFS